LKPIDMRWDGGGVKYLDILSMIFIVKNKNWRKCFFNYEYNFKLLILTSLAHLKQFFMKFPNYIKNQED
jgi:hypothetical protein